jgi:hypothetical protein
LGGQRVTRLIEGDKMYHIQKSLPLILFMALVGCSGKISTIEIDTNTLTPSSTKSGYTLTLESRNIIRTVEKLPNSGKYVQIVNDGSLLLIDIDYEYGLIMPKGSKVQTEGIAEITGLPNIQLEERFLVTFSNIKILIASIPDPNNKLGSIDGLANKLLAELKENNQGGGNINDIQSETGVPVKVINYSDTTNGVQIWEAVFKTNDIYILLYGKYSSMLFGFYLEGIVNTIWIINT